jgi:hypothetical protein
MYLIPQAFCRELWMGESSGAFDSGPEWQSAGPQAQYVQGITFALFKTRLQDSLRRKGFGPYVPFWGSDPGPSALRWQR